MSATVSKGQYFTLDNAKYNLSHIAVGFGWELPSRTQSLWEHWFSDFHAEYEIDVIALLCGINGKILDLGWSEDGEPSFTNSDVIFFNNLRHPSGHVWLGGGGYHRVEQHDDTEQVMIQLHNLDHKYRRIVFMIQMYDAVRNNHELAQLKNAYIRISDATGQPIVKFMLGDLSEYTQQRSMLFAELVHTNHEWVFKPIAQGSRSDSFIDWLSYYV